MPPKSNAAGKTDSGWGVRSMTGHGHASGQTEAGDVRIEVRTVNHRGFKCNVRLSDGLSGMEGKVESTTRQWIHRGSINLNVSLSASADSRGGLINADVLAAYLKQCENAFRLSELSAPQATIDVASLMDLPGVISFGPTGAADDENLWAQVEEILVSCLRNLVDMRKREGAEMAQSLLVDCGEIRRHLDKIAELAPQSAEAYRDRLETKIRRWLEEHQQTVDSVDLLREVQIYADRADVSEEITRLGSHLKLFREVLGGSADGSEEPTGRKLDFIIQEMFRETNTIGSKAANSDVSASVVEIKCAIERMRELVQNLE